MSTRDRLPNTLHLLSWNIDGLDKKYTVDRALAVCDVIESEKPEVVYLQEIVTSTWIAITERLGDSYTFYRDEVSIHYFHILMVRNGSSVVVQGDLQILKFPKSAQGRHLLFLPVEFHGVPIQLMTSHLESLNHCTAERQNQLQTVFDLMQELCSASKSCIFGGDLNLIDKEVTRVKLPEGVVDVWEACGSQVKWKYTWDSAEPRFRLDRIYFLPNDPLKLKPTQFGLIGSELLKCGVLPSDHLGMWAEFTVSP